MLPATCSVSCRVGPSHTSRRVPARTASRMRAESLSGLNPAATNMFVSATTDNMVSPQAVRIASGQREAVAGRAQTLSSRDRTTSRRVEAFQSVGHPPAQIDLVADVQLPAGKIHLLDQEVNQLADAQHGLIEREVDGKHPGRARLQELQLGVGGEHEDQLGVLDLHLVERQLGERVADVRREVPPLDRDVYIV